MRTPASPNTADTLVGRDRDLAVLQQYLDAALAGQGRLVLIGGEAGIGKTALAEVICGDATAQDALILTGRCFDLAETPAYGPWLYLFERYHPGSHLPPHPAAFAEAGTVGVVASQAALFRQVLEFLNLLTAVRPVVVLFDDLHWSDPASLELLRFVAHSVAALPLLMLVTYRSDELTRGHSLSALLPLLVREASAERLDLRVLDNAAVQMLVANRYHLPEVDATRLIAYLQERADGNALFIGELLRSLEEMGILGRVANTWGLGNLTNTAVPPLLRQVIDGRLARLDAMSQHLLTIASVIGHEVLIAVWTAVAEVDEEMLLAVIAEGEAARLMAENQGGTGATFMHALIRQALYEGTRPSQRRHWHRRCGEILAASSPPDPDTIADHFQRAGDERAAEWLVKAGDRADRAWAWPTASDRYEAAIALLGQTDATATQRGWLFFRLTRLHAYYRAQRGLIYAEDALRLAIAGGDQLLAAESRYRQGVLLRLRGDVQRGIAEMAASIAALHALSATDRSRLETSDIKGVVDEDHARAALLDSLSCSGRYTEIEALSFDRPVGAPLAYATRGLARMHAALGRPKEARRAYVLARDGLTAMGEDLEAALTTLGELREVALTYQADDVQRRRHLAAEVERIHTRAANFQPNVPVQRGRLPLMMVEGQWSEAWAVGLRLLEVGDAHGVYVSLARSVLGFIAFERGESDRARTWVQEALPAGPATAPGDTLWFGDSIVTQRLAALLAINVGDFGAARQWLEAHDRWLAWNGSILGQAEGHLCWAVYYRASGDAPQGYDSAMRAYRHATEPRQPLALLAAHRLLGEFDAEAGRYPEATAHLDAALFLAEACVAPYEKALILLALAECRGASEKKAAVSLLAEVRAICGLLAARPALAKADALARRLGIVRGAPPASPAGLSVRELEVLRLIAAGQTNREIAAALFLSRHTVGIHVAHILQKTNSDNRAAAASFALRHGLI